MPAPAAGDLAASLASLTGHQPLPARWRRGGEFRSRLKGILGARDDLEAVAAWLAEHAVSKGAESSAANPKLKPGRRRGSPETLRKYRREAERLLVWAFLVRDTPLSGLTREDFQAYRDFLAEDPELRVAGLPEAAGAVLRRLFPGRRPAARETAGQADRVARQQALDERSVDQALRTVAALMGYLHNTGYLRENPLKIGALQMAARESYRPSQRALSAEAWDAVQRVIDAMPRKTPRERFLQWRVRIMFGLMYWCAARRGDLEHARWRDFSPEPVQGETLWYWHLVGKGNKPASLPVVSALVDELQEFQRAMGFQPWAAQHLDLPVLPRSCGSDGKTINPAPLGGRHILRIAKEVFARAADLLDPGDGSAEPTRVADARRLRAASTHWSRHTSITHMLENEVDLRFVQEIARHGSINTTRTYIGDNERAKHEQLERAASRLSRFR